MCSKVDQMNYLQTEHSSNIAKARVQAARSNEKYPPQPASHNFQGANINTSALSKRRTSSTKDLQGAAPAHPNGFNSTRRPMAGANHQAQKTLLTTQLNFPSSK